MMSRNRIGRLLQPLPSVVVVLPFPLPLQPRSSRSCTTTTTATTTTTSVPTGHISNRSFSNGWTGARGHDITNDSLLFSEYDKDMGLLPKINVSGYDAHGFVVKHMIQKVVMTINTTTHTTSRRSRGITPALVDVQNHSEADSDGSVYMNGSIIVYPTGCFLWNIVPHPPPPVLPQPSSSSPSHHIISIESLSAIALLRPQIEYLFIGCNSSSNNENGARITNLNEIQYYFRHIHSNNNNNNTHRGIVVEQMPLYNAIGTFNLLNAEDRSVAAALMVHDNDNDD